MFVLRPPDKQGQGPHKLSATTAAQLQIILHPRSHSCEHSQASASASDVSLHGFVFPSAVEKTKDSRSRDVTVSGGRSSHFLRERSSPSSAPSWGFWWIFPSLRDVELMLRLTCDPDLLELLALLGHSQNGERYGFISHPTQKLPTLALLLPEHVK